MNNTPWSQANQALKESHYELLCLTATADDTITATWLNPADGSQQSLNVPVIDQHFPSLTPTLLEVAWDEREIHDLFGYLPEGHPDLRPLVRTPRWPERFFPLKNASVDPPPWRALEPDNPAVTVQGEGVTIMKVGPSHAGIIESGHFIFSLIGENVLHLDAHLFQNHRGVEAQLEGLTVSEVAPLISRLCAADTVSHQTNWALAVESLSDFEASQTLEWRRIVLLESERILSHLNDLAQIPAGVGFQVAHQRALAIKEYWQRGLLLIYGHRFLFDTVKPGWAHPGSAEDMIALLDAMAPKWKAWRALVEGHHGFQDRMEGVGIVQPIDAVHFGAQGVAARAAGKAFDARTVLPWYRSFDLQPSISLAGDVKARFSVRLNELDESFRLVEQACTLLRQKGNLLAGNDLTQGASGRVITFTESPHGLNVHDVVLNAGHVTRYHVRAGTYRNWPLLAKTVAGNTVADFPLINKSFELCYSCNDR